MIFLVLLLSVALKCTLKQLIWNYFLFLIYRLPLFKTTYDISNFWKKKSCSRREKCWLCCFVLCFTAGQGPSGLTGKSTFSPAVCLESGPCPSPPSSLTRDVRWSRWSGQQLTGAAMADRPNTVCVTVLHSVLAPCAAEHGRNKATGTSTCWHLCRLSSPSPAHFSHPLLRTKSSLVFFFIIMQLFRYVQMHKIWLRPVVCWNLVNRHLLLWPTKPRKTYAASTLSSRV